MPITFKCERCGQELLVKEEMIGQQGKCPKCLCVQTILSLEVPPDPQLEVPVAAAWQPEIPVAAAWQPEAPIEEEVIDAEIIGPDDRLTDLPREERRPASSRERRESDEPMNDRPLRPSFEQEDEQDEVRRKKKRKKSTKAGWGQARIGLQLNIVSMYLYATIWGSFLFGMLIGGCMGLMRALEAASTLGLIIGYCCRVLFLGMWVLALIGYIFGIMTPGKHGEKALAIAATAILGTELLLLLVTLVTSQAALAGSFGGRQGQMAVPSSLDGLILLCLILEIARNMVYAFYLRSVGLSLRDSEIRDAGAALTILVPVIAVGVPLLDFLGVTCVIANIRARAVVGIFALILMAGTGAAFFYLCMAYAGRLSLAREEIDVRV